MFFFFRILVETGICNICVFTKRAKEFSSNLTFMDPRSQGKREAKNRYFSLSCSHGEKRKLQRACWDQQTWGIKVFSHQ
jgi:hypothetical protein